MHTLRGGPAKPARSVVLTREEGEALRASGLVRARAWSLDGLGALVGDLASRLQFLRAEAVESVCREAGVRALPEALRPRVEARLAASPEARALRLGLDAGREAAARQMTLTYEPDGPPG